MRTARAVVVLCTLLCGAWSLPQPPSAPAERSASEERDRAAIQTFFDGLRDITLAGGFEARFYIPEKDRETLLAFLDRMNEIALATVRDRNLSKEARSKKEFLAVLDVLQEFIRGDDNEEPAYKEAFTNAVEQLKAVVQAQPDDAPPRWLEFLPAMDRFFDLARERGACDEDVERFLAVMKSLLGEIPNETEIPDGYELQTLFRQYNE